MMRRIGFAGALAMLAAVAFADGMGSGGHMPGHGVDGQGHDEAMMPGLGGLNVEPGESDDMRLLFRNFPSLTREVTLLPDGIRTVTRSSDPEVMAALVRHVTGMTARVQAADDPQVYIQSPTLADLFARPEVIETAVEVTETGIVVEQTSADPGMAATLKRHAAEVSDMAARGMQAVHDRVMRQPVN